MRSEAAVSRRLLGSRAPGSAGFNPELQAGATETCTAYRLLLPCAQRDSRLSDRQRICVEDMHALLATNETLERPSAPWAPAIRSRFSRIPAPLLDPPVAPVALGGASLVREGL